MEQRWFVSALAAAGLAFVFLPSNLLAAPTSVYSCEVLTTSEIKDGRIQEKSVGPAGHKMNGERFIVLVKTGEMVGKTFKSRFWTHTQLLDNGNDPRGSSLKVLYTSPAGSYVNWAILQIQPKYETKQLRQTFVFMDTPYIYSGDCEAND